MEVTKRNLPILRALYKIQTLTERIETVFTVNQGKTKMDIINQV